MVRDDHLVQAGPCGRPRRDAPCRRGWTWALEQHTATATNTNNNNNNNNKKTTRIEKDGPGPPIAGRGVSVWRRHTRRPLVDKVPGCMPGFPALISLISSHLVPSVRPSVSCSLRSCWNIGGTHQSIQTHTRTHARTHTHNSRTLSRRCWRSCRSESSIFVLYALTASSSGMRTRASCVRRAKKNNHPVFFSSRRQEGSDRESILDAKGVQRPLKSQTKIFRGPKLCACHSPDEAHTN